jgi:hypothetical protein
MVWFFGVLLRRQKGVPKEEPDMWIRAFLYWQSMRVSSTISANGPRRDS